MATATIKSTYSLDVETVRQLEELARKWNLSKSAALRQAIAEAAGRATPLATEKLKALDELQRRLALDASKVSAWTEEVRQERLASQRLRLG